MIVCSEPPSKATGILRRAASADRAESGGGCREAHTLASNVAGARLDESPSGGGKGLVETTDGGFLNCSNAGCFMRLLDPCKCLFEDSTNALREKRLRTTGGIVEGFMG